NQTHDRLRALASKADLVPKLSVSVSGLFKSIPPNLGYGYLKYENDNGKKVVSILPGHGLALALFSLSVFIYLLIGLLKFKNSLFSSVPPLAYVILLLLLLCWGLSGLAFFFDRYRIPVLISLALWLLVTSQFPQSDHYYQ